MSHCYQHPSCLASTDMSCSKSTRTAYPAVAWTRVWQPRRRKRCEHALMGSSSLPPRACGPAGPAVHGLARRQRSNRLTTSRGLPPALVLRATQPKPGPASRPPHGAPARVGLAAHGPLQHQRPPNLLLPAPPAPGASASAHMPQQTTSPPPCLPRQLSPQEEAALRAAGGHATALPLVPGLLAAPMKQSRASHQGVRHAELVGRAVCREAGRQQQQQQDQSLARTGRALTVNRKARPSSRGRTPSQARVRVGL
ncbi:hypothetical protein V8C86DRAFT_2459527 [Haematococcus lacustris]